MTLIETLQTEIERVTEVHKIYQDVGPPGAMAAAMMYLNIKKAKQAIQEHDTVAMVKNLSQLKEWNL